MNVGSAGDGGRAQALAELLALRAELQIARAEIYALHVQAGLAASADLPASIQLRDANQALVLALLKSRSDADIAARALDDATHATHTDSLTGLPDRAELLARTDAAIADAGSGVVALVFVNIDNFKRINDSLGHAVGDEVLKAAAAALLGCAPPPVMVSRHGGDEFVILVPRLARCVDAQDTARCLLDALGSPQNLGAHVFRLSACVGVACYPEHGGSAAELLEHAASDMLGAKRESRARAGRSWTPHARSKAPSAPLLAAIAEKDRRSSLMREANEHLVVAALGAQELHRSAEQAHNRQAEFLAVLAHELRSPLAPIRTAAELMGRLRSPDNETTARFQQIIERQVMHLSRLVADLADFSRANFGKLRIQKADADFLAIADQALDAIRPAMDARGQHCHVQLPDVPVPVHGDAARLVQVLVNLLDNASKYTPDRGDVWLDVALANGCVRVSVADNGIGISASALPGIFEPFVQDEHAVEFSSGGMGIGLTVVRELVQAHGGSIRATSAGPGMGSRFEVSLPIEAREGASPQRS